MQTHGFSNQIIMGNNGHIKHKELAIYEDDLKVASHLKNILRLRISFQFNIY